MHTTNEQQERQQDLTPATRFVSADLEARIRSVVRTIFHEPFARRTWCELLFLILGSALVFAGLAFVAVTMAVGIVLVITFIGLAVIALALRTSRGLGRWNRQMARSLLDEQIAEPEPFAPRRGFLGWLQSALRDRTAWRSMAYLVVKAPLALFGIWAALSLWIEALLCLMSVFQMEPAHLNFGVSRVLFGAGNSNGSFGFGNRLAALLAGVFFVLVAPWAVRAVVALDRILMRALLSPDALTVRVRTLEQARAQTVDSSAAALRKIERDLHDGTQARLVALAMRLGMAKEKLADSAQPVDLDQVRELVDGAHHETKEIIVELRDLTRGIHPPALDVGLEGALATLAARSSVPTDLSVTLTDRPTPAIEAIAYFCVAELLANVAQHAQASRAAVSCVQAGERLRVVVRDDGIGGARCSSLGSSSSGLNGLGDRVTAVDGHIAIESPERGPTVVTVDLPLHA